MFRVCRGVQGASSVFEACRSVFAEAPLLLEPAHRSLEPLLDRRPRQVLQHLEKQKRLKKVQGMKNFDVERETSDSRSR